MLRLITVDPGLKEIKSYLNERGYEVTDMDQCVRPVEAVVYSGSALTDSMAQYPVADNTVLVNAAGLTPQEVESQLLARLG
ncbi:MAG: YkuS family protein [Negativicutes bacterium]|nr:YkuS family protein [Negativicutes bacterium]